MYKCRGGHGWPRATDVHGCTSVAEATDGLERPFGIAISIKMAVKRAHGARYDFSTPNEFRITKFLSDTPTQERGSEIFRIVILGYSSAAYYFMPLNHNLYL